VLVSEVPRFKKLIDDVEYTGKEFRQESLYSSAPFIRVLADVFHQLALKESAVISDGDAIKTYEVEQASGSRCLVRNFTFPSRIKRTRFSFSRA
jgi:hypothetical protein